MTNDVTRGLSLLADEVTPAPIDTHAVIDRARARTRNRRATAATAFAVAAASALTITITSGGTDDTVPVGDSPDRATRLTEQLAAVRGTAFPADWELLPASEPGLWQTEVHGDEPLDFACEEMAPPPRKPAEVCQALGLFADGDVRIHVAIQVWGGGVGVMACPPDGACPQSRRPDGTGYSSEVSTNSVVGVPNILGQDVDTMSVQHLTVLRPDGTVMAMNVGWTGPESAPPFDTDRLVALATAFTF